MSSYDFDPERTASQIAKMNELGDRWRRLALLRRLTNRRARAVQEPGELPRVPLRLVRPLQPQDPDGVVLDPLLVVPDQIVVRVDARQAAEDALRGAGWLADEPEQAAEEGAARGQAELDAQQRPDRAVTLHLRRSVSVTKAIRLLRRRGVEGVSATHIVALGGRAKGGSTPKRTDVVLPPRPDDPIADSPKVIVIDTGVDAAAIGLQAFDNRDDGWLDHVVADAVGDHIDPLDTTDYFGSVGPDDYLDLAAGHGTFVAGAIRQQSPTANITMIRVLDTDGLGSERVIEDAIDRAAVLFGDEPGLLNLSLGLETIDGLAPVGIRDAIDALPDNVLVIAAAGNGPTGIKVWPAALSAANENVLAVASVTRSPAGTLTPSTWSNFGPWVSFSAFGEGVLSTFVEGTETRGSGREDDPFDPDPDTFLPPNPYATWSGTSFATAKITGELARVLTANPGLGVRGAVDDLRQRGTVLTNYGTALEV